MGSFDTLKMEMGQQFYNIDFRQVSPTVLIPVLVLQSISTGTDTVIQSTLF